MSPALIGTGSGVVSIFAAAGQGRLFVAVVATVLTVFVPSWRRPAGVATT